MIKKYEPARKEIIQGWSGAEKELISLHLQYKKIADFEKNDFNELDTELQRLAITVGIINPIKEPEMTELMRFLRDHFSDFSIDEIVHALNLAIAGIYGSEWTEKHINHYQNFNKVYLSPALNKYREIRNPVAVKYWDSLDKWIAEEKVKNRPKPSEEQLKDIMKSAALRAFEEFKRNEPLFDFGGKILQYLTDEQVVDPEHYKTKMKKAFPVSHYQKFGTSEINIQVLTLFFTDLKKEEKELQDLFKKEKPEATDQPQSQPQEKSQP